MTWYASMNCCIHCRLWRTRASYNTATGRLTSSFSRFQFSAATPAVVQDSGNAPRPLPFTSNKAAGEDEFVMAGARVWKIFT
ncbi:hypothetical protein D3C78_1587430 [compost metagenome]